MCSIEYCSDGKQSNLLRGSSCAFGVFDGFHRGHRYLVEKVKEHASQVGVPSCVLTFNIDPDELFAGERLRKLMSNEERINALSHSGVDRVVVLKFTREFASLPPQMFLRNVLEPSLPESIHVGCDIRFGNKAEGTVDDMKAWSSRLGVKVFPYNLLEIDGAPVSATRIRSLLDKGLDSAAQPLL